MDYSEGDKILGKKIDFQSYFRELLSLLTNKSYVAVCLWMVLMFAGLGVIGVVNPLA